MKIIVIGNGSTVLYRENGHRIDRFDYVVRMGLCKIKGYEKFTGTKTDMYRVTWPKCFCISGDTVTHIHTELTGFKDILFTGVYDYDNFTETENFFSKRIKHPLFVRNLYVKRHNMTRFIHDRCLQFFLSHHPYVKNIFYCNAKRRAELLKIICKDDNKIKPTNGMLTLDYIINKFPQEEIYVTGYDGMLTKHYFRNTETYEISHNNIKEHIYLKQLAKTGKIKYLE